MTGAMGWCRMLETSFRIRVACLRDPRSLLGFLFAFLLFVSVQPARADSTLDVEQVNALTVQATWTYDGDTCPPIGVCTSLNLDWGDGSPAVNIPFAPTTGRRNHTYATHGAYTVRLFCANNPTLPRCNPAETLYVTSRFQVTPSPNRARLVPGQSYDFNVTYTLSGGGTFTAESAEGRFVTRGGSILGRVGRRLDIQARNATGTARETIQLPSALIERVRKRGEGSFRYTRLFESAGNQAEAAVVFQIVPSSAGPFSLVRMQLVFENTEAREKGRPALERGRVTLPRHSEAWVAKARLTYNGSGLLRAQWRVDDQIIGHVNRFLHPGRRRVTLESPGVPGLPTYDTGRHRVELVILNPAPAFDEPVAFYYVRPERRSSLEDIRLLSPEDRARLAAGTGSFQAPAFQWQPLEGKHTYLFTLRPARTFQGREPGPVVKALTPDGSYALSRLDRAKLADHVPYAWTVRAYAEGDLAGESRERTVYFAPPQKRSDRLSLQDLRVDVLQPPSQPKAPGGPVEEGRRVRMAAAMKNQGENSLYNVGVEFLIGETLVDTSFFASVLPGAVIQLEGIGIALESRDVVVRAVQGANDEKRILHAIHGTVHP